MSTSELISFTLTAISILSRFLWLASAVLLAAHAYVWLRYGVWQPFRLVDVFPDLYMQQHITGWVMIDFAILETASWPVCFVVPVASSIILGLIAVVVELLEP